MQGGESSHKKIQSSWFTSLHVMHYQRVTIINKKLNHRFIETEKVEQIKDKFIFYNLSVFAVEETYSFLQSDTEAQD